MKNRVIEVGFNYPAYTFLKTYYFLLAILLRINKLLILLFSKALRIAIANNSLVEATFILSHWPLRGIVSQTTNSSNTLF